MRSRRGLQHPGTGLGLSLLQDPSGMSSSRVISKENKAVCDPKSKGCHPELNTVPKPGFLFVSQCEGEKREEARTHLSQQLLGQIGRTGFEERAGLAEGRHNSTSALKGRLETLLAANAVVVK